MVLLFFVHRDQHVKTIRNEVQVNTKRMVVKMVENQVEVKSASVSQPHTSRSKKE